MQILDGQRLSSVAVSNTDASTVFAFDLGCTLSTRPVEHDVSPEPAEQWMLYQPSGQVLTIRADGRYEQKPGDSSSEQCWLPIP